MRIVLATAFALCVFCLFSCHKEDSLEPTLSHSGNDSAFLSKLAFVDTLAVTGLDTTFIYRFKYDNKKRLVALFVDEYFINKPGAQLWNIYEYFYFGNETLPNKVYHRSGNYRTGSVGDPITSFIWYSGGVVAKDSVVRIGINPVNYARHYTKISNTRYKTVYSGSANNKIPDSVYSQVTKVNGCITYQKDSIYTHGGAISIEEKFASFDNNPNPFYRISIPYPLAGQTINEKAPHNRVRLKQAPHLGQAVEEIFEYQYRKDGYPIFSRSGTPHNATKGIFIYTGL